MRYLYRLESFLIIEIALLLAMERWSSLIGKQKSHGCAMQFTGY